MAYTCDNCGKGVDRGNLVSHAKNRTKTLRRPNLHRATIVVNGKKVKMRLCTKCLRRVKEKAKKKEQSQKSGQEIKIKE